MIRCFPWRHVYRRILENSGSEFKTQHFGLFPSTFYFNFRKLHSKILPEDIEFHRGCSDPNLKGVCKSYKNVSKCTDLDPKRKGVALDVWIWSQQSIAYAIWNIAEACHSYPLYEQHYKMICGIMKDSMFGFCEMKAAMIMSLVAMQRYDEAYRMIQFLFMIFTKMDSKMVAVMMSKLPIEAWSEILESGLAECHSIMVILSARFCMKS